MDDELRIEKRCFNVDNVDESNYIGKLTLTAQEITSLQTLALNEATLALNSVTTLVF